MPLRKLLSALALQALTLAILPAVATAAPPDHPNILQRPAMSSTTIAFGYAGDLWTVPRAGGRATRLTAGVGIESAPFFSPDGQTLAFTGQYDGNTDVFTIPVTGGIPKRLTFHPDPDFAVGWTRNGKNVLFRSTRASASRYTQLFTMPANGGQATALPLPMAYAGDYSPDGSRVAYTPLPPAFGFDFTNYTAWGNYRGGRAGVIHITTLPGLDSTEVPHEASSDFSPVYIGSDILFLSGRNGHIGVFRYTPGSKDVTEIFRNTGTDIHSLATDGHDLIFDQLGELYTLEPKPGAQPHEVPIDVAADLPEVRPHLENVAGEIEHISLSPEAVRIAVEAHGEILTVPVKHGPVRNLTNSPGSMEREPAWSPDGQSIAFFSDEPAPGGRPGLYSLHIVSQTGAGPVKKFALAPEPAFYFDPLWSPDSKRIVFRDNRLHFYLLDVATGKLNTIGEPGTFGGFSRAATDIAWSPDSKWLVYPRSLPNHLHALFLYSVEKATSTQLTNEMADAQVPAFDHNGKYLYFLASNNEGATEAGLDMTSDLYQPTQSIYALTLAAKTASPVAPELDDEKTPAEAKAKAGEKADNTPAGEAGVAKADEEKNPNAGHPAPPLKPTEIDLPGMSLDAIAHRIVALPLPPRHYNDLRTGKPGTIYFLEATSTGRFVEDSGDTLNRWTVESRKTEKLADHIESFRINADGDKMLLVLAPEGEGNDRGGTPPGGHRPAPRMVVVPANAPAKPGEGAVSFAQVEVRVDPKAEWAQMYHEVWRIERAYFYDAHFHGANTQELERKYQPYVASIASRADLNYIFQEMLSAFSVGHLRGSGGAIPTAPRVPGGLLGADYVIKNDLYCLAKIYTGGSWSPDLHAPLAQPGLDIAPGDCILAINNETLTADTDIQQPLEGTAGHAVTLHITGPNGDRPRDLVVIPIASEYALRNTDWIDTNQRKVAELSGGKLAYVYLPDTAAGGFTNFNRYFFAQTNRQGVIVDERFNGGGQIADYIIEVLNRKLQSFWAPRYGAIEHTPNDAIFGPKVMIANEFSGSGGDAMPWLFKYNHLGTLVGKRTWGGLVGIGQIPVLMDGGNVTSPSVAFFNPEGKWDVENHGVDPDVVVEQDPKAVAEGHDPQLEKSVSVALEQLAQHPNPEPHKPAYPTYSY